MTSNTTCESQNLKIIVGKIRMYFIAVINDLKGLGSIKFLLKKNVNFILFNEYCNLLKSFDLTEEEKDYLTCEIKGFLNFVNNPYNSEDYSHKIIITMRSKLNKILTNLQS